MDAEELKIRNASSDEAETLTQIAHDAKRHWGYPEHWINHWQEDLTITPEYVSENLVMVAESENDGKIAGFYALINRGEKSELDHMWVAPAHIGTGLGKQLFVHAMQQAGSRNISEVQICSDPNAEGFYSKMGAYRIGETVSEIDGEARVLPLMIFKSPTS